MMQQTKLESFIEKTVDISTGFVISVFVYKYIVLPQDWLWSSPIYVTILFTIISLFRGYLWRRFFNAGLHKSVKQIVGKFYERKRHP